MMLKVLFRQLVTFFAIAAASLGFSQEAQKPDIKYYDLDPNIITNYQKPPSRRLGFVTVDVQFQVRGEEGLDILDYHKPLIEDALIDVINSQPEEVIKDNTKRSEIRDAIKTKLTAILKEETGKEVIEDVLFTKFIYQ
jgi:flagellar FliL protein